MDGYDYARPNGKKYLGIVGPWILPNFGRKAITNKTQQKAIIKYLVDEYNKMLADMDKKNPRFHHIDLRGKFPHDHQWHNEIHLKGDEYRVVAGMYHERMMKILGKDPLTE